MFKRTALILLLCIQPYIAYADEQTKVVLHLNDSFKFTHLESSVNNIRTEMGDNVEIKVVINGKAVQKMLKSEKIIAIIMNNILQDNAEIGLCHNALRANKVKKSMLIQGLNVLPQDGNVTIINLRKKGYIYIKI